MSIFTCSQHDYLQSLPPPPKKKTVKQHEGVTTTFTFTFTFNSVGANQPESRCLVSQLLKKMLISWAKL